MANRGEEIVREGYLAKKSTKLRRFSSPYKLRWFSLTKNTLSYYYTDSDGGKEKGKIGLELVRWVERVDFGAEESSGNEIGYTPPLTCLSFKTSQIRTKPHSGFQVGIAGESIKSTRILYVKAIDPADRDLWIASIRQCVEGRLSIGALTSISQAYYHRGLWSPSSLKWLCCNSILEECEAEGCVPVTQFSHLISSSNSSSSSSDEAENRTSTLKKEKKSGVNSRPLSKSHPLSRPNSQHTNSRSISNSHPIPRPNSNSHPISRPNSNLHGISRPNSNLHAISRPNSNSHPNPRPNSNSHAISHSNSNLHPNSDSHAISHSNSNLHAISRPNFNSHAISRPVTISHLQSNSNLLVNAHAISQLDQGSNLNLNSDLSSASHSRSNSNSQLNCHSRSNSNSVSTSQLNSKVNLGKYSHFYGKEEKVKGHVLNNLNNLNATELSNSLSYFSSSASNLLSTPPPLSSRSNGNNIFGLPQYVPGSRKGSSTLSLSVSHSRENSGLTPSHTPQSSSLSFISNQEMASGNPGTPLKNRENGSSSSSRRVVVALYSFKAIESGDLSLEKGDEYEIVDDSQEHWWQVRDKNGTVGYIPSNYVKEKELLGLQKWDWYVGDMSRQRAETLLRYDDKEGCFVVRNSSTKGLYTLSLYTKVPHAQVKHYHIRQNSRSEFYLSEKHTCPSINELINYHRHNRGGLASRLKLPPSTERSAPPTAGLSHDKWEIDPSELMLHEELGSGQFGVVRRGKWRASIDVAVKMMKEGTMSEDDFIEEAKVMTKLQHQNLVQLYGVCSKHRPIYIVTEYMKHGALLNYLRRYETSLTTNLGMLLDISLQVCKGMAYLERHNYIHRDLAARNCLVGAENVVKVADFGLARYVLDDQYTSSGGTKFPIKWAPPEVLNYTRFSSKSDIWAYGVLLWEVFTCGKMPYGRLKNTEVVERVQRGVILERPKNSPKEAYELMKNCWALSPEDRPSFRTLSSSLATLSQLLLVD